MSPMVRVLVLGAAEQAERRMVEMRRMFIVTDERSESGLSSPDE